MPVTVTDYPAALIAAGAASDERTIRTLRIPTPGEISDWANMTYDRVEGHLCWADFQKGNAVMVSTGTNAAPGLPAPVQISQGNLLGRGTGNVASDRLGDFQALSTSTITDFFDVNAGTAAAGNTLVEQGDGTYTFQALDLTQLGDCPSTYGSDGQILETNGTDTIAWRDPHVYVGTSAPGATDGGTLWYNTTSGVNELFYYDTTRAAWLSVRLIEVIGVSSGSLGPGPGVYMTNPGVGAGSAVNGVYVGHDVVVCAVEFNSNTASGDVNFQVDLMQDGSTIATHTVGTSRQAAGYAKNLPGTAGTYAITIGNGTSGTQPTCRWWLRRKTS